MSIFTSTVSKLTSTGESKDGIFTSTLSTIHFYRVSKDFYSFQFTSTAYNSFLQGSSDHGDL